MTSTLTATPLAQHIVPCPACTHTAAVHVCLDGAEPTAVRVVCSAGCRDSDALRVAAIDALYPLAATA
jgi:hypothetical protein